MKARTLASHVLPWLTAAALVPALACDPQVGTSYTGEVMFSLHGDVILRRWYIGVNARGEIHLFNLQDNALVEPSLRLGFAVRGSAVLGVQY